MTFLHHWAEIQTWRCVFLQGSVPPVMAFHLGSLGFLTPFKFESYKTEVAKVFEGTITLFFKMGSTHLNGDSMWAFRQRSHHPPQSPEGKGGEGYASESRPADPNPWDAAAGIQRAPCSRLRQQRVWQSHAAATGEECLRTRGRGDTSGTELQHNNSTWKGKIPLQTHVNGDYLVVPVFYSNAVLSLKPFLPDFQTLLN